MDIEIVGGTMRSGARVFPIVQCGLGLARALATAAAVIVLEGSGRWKQGTGRCRDTGRRLITSAPRHLAGRAQRGAPGMLLLRGGWMDGSGRLRLDGRSRGECEGRLAADILCVRGGTGLGSRGQKLVVRPSPPVGRLKRERDALCRTAAGFGIGRLAQLRRARGRERVLGG